MGDFHLEIDTGRINRALFLFAYHSKKSGLDVLLDQSKGSVRRAIALTPPSRGKADSAARKLGEDALHDDLKQIFDPIDPAEWKAFFDAEGGLKIVPTSRANGRGAAVTDLTLFLKRNDMEAFHESLRSKSTGRVRHVNRDNLIGRKRSDISQIAFVTKSDFAWFERENRKKVGKLASGWNAAAQKLGYNPPAWIRRHGTSRGQFDLVITPDRFSVTATNDVRFSNQVKGLERQIQTALNQQAEAMEKRLAFFLEKQAARAGIK
jgi:hypothetical protein